MMSNASTPQTVPHTELNLRERWLAVKRRRWPMLGALAITTLLALCAALLWPPTYTSVGTILIEQQELPTELVRSTISSYADQRLQVITQRVMTTENLYRIIQRYDLYAKERTRKVREVIIKRMRDDIHFEMISAEVIDPRFGHPTKATIAFSISYSNRSPDLAAKVANELVTLYLQENMESRAQRAADATSFLDDEANRLAKRIEELQSGMTSFKEQNLNELPELAQLNIQLLNRTEEELRTVDTRVRSLDQQLVYLDAQLAQINPTSQIYASTGERIMSPQDRLKYLRSEYARVSALYAPTHPDVLRVRREIEGLERDVGKVESGNDLARQLQAARTELASLRERYATDHPDVTRVTRLVAALEAQATQSRVKSNAAVDADNPAYLQVNAQREASANERTALLTQRRQLQTRIDELERRMENAPGVEHEYTALARELEGAQAKYREVRQKQMEAQVSQNLEDERKGERFTLIEPPIVPQQPASPARWIIVLVGVGAGVAIAIGLLALLESLDGSVRGRNRLTALLQTPPLAVLPWIDTSMERRKRARVRKLAFGGGAAAFVSLLVLMHVFYRPLDVLWQVAIRRLGG